MTWLGRPPIPRLPFALGKLAIAASWAFLAAHFVGLGPAIPAPLALRVAAACLLAVGLPLFVVAMWQLGRSLRVGLPDEPTELETAGLYAHSRNPIYVAVFLVCTASSLYWPHPVNVACTLAAMAIHHRIVLAEERFLEQRFGQQWRSYAARVRRYV